MRKVKSMRIGDIMFNIALYAICFIILISIIYPLYFVVIASISNSHLVAGGQVVLYPKSINFFGYSEILKDARIWIGYKNTIIYTVLGTAVNLAFTLPAAYTLSIKKFRARRPIMLLFIFTMFFNGGLVPTYLLMNALKINNTIWVFIFPFCVNVFYLIITRTFFENSVPPDLFEAASLDGCSHFRYFLTIMLPLSKAIIFVIGLYYLVGHWNDFFTGLIYIRSDKLVPLQIVLRDIVLINKVFSEGSGMGGNAGGYAQEYADTVKYSVIIVSTLPILIVYPFIQKYFEKGVMIGAIKG